MGLSILVVTRSLPVHLSGGLESAAWDLARCFADSGHSTTVLTTAHPALPTRGAVEGVGIRCVAAPPGRYSNAWWKGSAALFRTDFADTTDVVLGVSAAANALPPHRSRTRRQAFVFQAHGTSSGEIVSKLRLRTPKAYISTARNVYWLAFKDRVYREFDAVVSIGQAVNTQFHKWPTNRLLGSTPETMINNGVDTAQFAFNPSARARLRQELSIRSDARVVISLCRLHPQKGLSVGLAAFRQALNQDPTLKYLIAGDGPQMRDLRELISTLDLAQSARLLGPVPRDAVPAHLSAGDAFLFPTLRVEGLPITLLEALASGLPVIATPNGGDAALPCHWVPPEDVDATALEILKVSNVSQVRANALPAQFSLAYSCGQYIELFEELLGMRGADRLDSRLPPGRLGADEPRASCAQ